MSYTTPPNFVTGVVVTEANLDTLSDDITFLANPPKCAVYNSSSQSISNNTLTTLTFNSERQDTDTMHSTVTNTGRLTFTTAGFYLFGINVQFQAATDYTELLLIARLNGTTTIRSNRDRNPGTTNDVRELDLTRGYQFAAGDYIEFLARQQNGATAARNVEAQGNWSPEAWAVWQSL